MHRSLFVLFAFCLAVQTGCSTAAAYGANARLGSRRQLLQASLEYTTTYNGTAVSGNTTGTVTSLTCSCGYVKGVRVGVLPIDGTHAVAAVGDVKVICPTADGSEVLLGGSDVAGLDYTTVYLNGGQYEDAIPLLLGSDAITSFANVSASGATGTPATLSCPSTGKIFIGLQIETYTYATSEYAQLIRVRGSCVFPTASDVQCSTSVTSCPAGEILDAYSGLCEQCLAGTYQANVTNSTTGDVTAVCLSCPAGTYNDQSGQVGLTSCQACPTGKFAPNAGQQACTYPPLGSKVSADATSYSWCPPGTVGRDNRTDCEVCPAGYYRPGSSATPLNNICWRVPAGSRVNWVADSGGARSVTLCAAGTVSSWSDGTDTQAGWWPGQTAVDISLRTPTDPTMCTACQDNTVSFLSGSSTCEPCKAGTYPTTIAAPSPVTWTYTNSQGRDYSTVLQTNCAACSALYWKTSTDTSTTCSACGPGQATGQSDGAMTCTDCPPGYVNPGQVETFADNEANASYYNPQPNQAQYYSVAASASLGVSIKCQACPKGTYQPSAGQRKCLWCPAGQGTDDVGNAACNPCPLGSYSPSPLESCQLADAGYYVDTEGSSSQTQCQPGTYSTAPGSDACDACPAGFYASQYASKACSPCPAGSYSGPGAANCKACPAGTYSKLGSRSCMPCPPGHFNGLSAQSSCVKAPAGSFVPGKGHKAAIPCPQGQFSNKQGQVSCLKCPANKYQPLKGKTGCLSCCDSGTFMNTCFKWTRGQTGSAICYAMRPRRFSK